MKLTSKVISLFMIVSFLFALTSCEAIMGMLGITPDEPAGPEYPSIEFNDYGNGSATLHYGDSKTLTVSASVDDDGSLTYQWYKGTENNYEKASSISGANKASYTITAPNEEVEETYYWCKVTNKKNGKTESGWSYAYAITVSNIIRLAGEVISSETTWDPTYTYYISANYLTITNSLVIPAGTIVKLQTGTYINTFGEGTITVNGEKDKPVIFTSYRDNTVGITIPEFKNSATAPQKGDWAGMWIEGASASVIKYAVFKYANVSALTLSNETTVQNCLFTDNKSDDNSSGALTIIEAAKASTIKDNIFYNNDYPLCVVPDFTVDPSNIFHNPDDENVKNLKQAIVISGENHIFADSVTEWKITELPYYLKDFVQVNNSGSLSIGVNDNDEGKTVIVRCSIGCYIEALEGGTLTFDDNFILTSWKDDAHGGDFQGNGQPAKPKWGDWDGVYYYEDGYNNVINKDTTRVLYNDKTKYGETNPTE